jgi:hypothetical protein
MRPAGEREGKIRLSFLGTTLEAPFRVNVSEAPREPRAMPLDLAPHANFDAVAFEANRTDYTQSMGMFCYPADFTPSDRVVNLYAAPFRMLSLEDGRKNVVLPQGQKIEVPPGAWRAVAFLGYGHDGKHPGAWTFHYSDGTAQAVDSQIPEWCTPPPDGFHVAFTAPYRYIANGPAGPPCELFLWSLPLDPSKTLTRIEFPQMKHAYIFAATLLPAE